MTNHFIYKTKTDFVFCSEDKNPKVENHGDLTLLKTKKCNKEFSQCLECMEKHLVA